MGKYSNVEEKLISEVQKYPALWNTKDNNYKNKTIKENAWQEVAECVNKDSDTSYTVSEYKDRIWKNIRDNYVRALSGTAKKSGSGVDEAPQYPYLNAMSFLKPYVNIRAKNAESNFQLPIVQINDTLNQNKTNEDSSQLGCEKQLEVESQNTDLSGSTQSKKPSNMVVEDTTVQKPTRKRSYASMSQQHVDRAIDVKILEYLSGTKNPKESVITTPISAEDAFGKSVSAQLQLLDPEAKAVAMSEIQKVLCQAQIPQASMITQSHNNNPVLITPSWQEDE
ncbi:uncharacterized protein LOC114534419 [Dendronephthya gigantea]|uniref:uncharacterized protein LOC114529959 n=1 Tax=Dendronephthya gigantea TaxID=151771 RepID=UPI00106A55D1|nr:uncharacterized protein LOC114529959 [Dendronephthya gigantea]XP_028411664.1 uncharacterized protein LOC114534419 [Dendronephthya gigantea]